MRLVGMRGAPQMIRDIEAALPEDWLQGAEPAPITWMGAFTRTKILIAVRGCTEEATLFYEVGVSGHLHRVQLESDLVVACVFQRVRILGAWDWTWHIDPDPDLITEEFEWRLWAWESRPLARLQWDPREWHWRDPFAPDRPPLLLGTPWEAHFASAQKLLQSIGDDRA